MARCGYSILIQSNTACGSHWKDPKDEKCVTLHDCDKDVTSHLRFCNTFDSSIDSERKLLLYRAGAYVIVNHFFSLDALKVFKLFFSFSLGIFNDEDFESYNSLTICPAHRNNCGIGWKRGRKNCPIPDSIAGHKSKAKGDRGITSKESQYVVARTKLLIPLGTRK